MLLLEDLHEIWDKYYPWLEEDEFLAIIKIDPTGKEGRMGKYAKWLLNARKNKKDLFTDDEEKELKDQLEIFNKHSAKYAEEDRDLLKKCQSLEDLIALNSKYDASLEKSKEEIEAKQKEGVEVVGSTASWEVYRPLTWEASKYLRGDNAVWCTGRHDDMSWWNSYTKRRKDALYIFVNKKNRDDKYQAAVDQDGNIEELRNARNGWQDPIEFFLKRPDLIDIIKDRLSKAVKDELTEYQGYLKGELCTFTEQEFNDGNYARKIASAINVKVISKEVPLNLFNGCINLKTVVLEKTQNIGAFAFKGCINLEMVEIPSTLKRIEYNAFKGADKAKLIIKKGTKFSINKADKEYLVSHVEWKE